MVFIKNWLLSVPFTLRLLTLQGFTDGDGFATVKSQRLGIATTVNKDFLQKLLSTFNIGSTYEKSGRSIIIRRIECILKASSLPFFLHAVGRQSLSNKLAEMIKVRKTQRRIPLLESVIVRMMHFF